MMFMIRRRGTDPRVYVTESMPLFQSLRMHPMDSVMCHYMPVVVRAKRPDGRDWRVGMERSYAFMACFLELLCPKEGVCLELGCGTAPILKACIRTGCVCGSLDMDNDIISSCVQPLLAQAMQGPSMEAGSSMLGEEVDERAGENPYD